MLVFLDFDGSGLAVAKIGDSKDDKGTQAHDREDVREDCDGVDEFVHCGDSLIELLTTVNFEDRFKLGTTGESGERRQAIVASASVIVPESVFFF